MDATTNHDMYGAYNNDRNHDDNNLQSNSFLTYDDPAVINPDELATFPKQVVKSDGTHHHHHESHLVNKRTPVREGRNITRTDNNPDRHGFM